ncbi:MAG TPA: hypothetical protein DDZ51_17245 [Planctomycetaceae bacterium]|nr:hypothetical protein [Planctomycetaceae bacterium]
MKPVASIRTPATATTPKGRNAALDSVRGLAIVLMIVDHVAVISFDIPIGTDNVRLVTRLALPLFAIVFGFFLIDPSLSLSQRKTTTKVAAPNRSTWAAFRRPAQILVAAFAANLLFVPEYGRLEILVSFLACSLLYLVLGRYFIAMLLAVVLFQYDPTLNLLDYPLTLTASLVAIGMVLRLYGFQKAILAAAVVTVAGLAAVPAPPLFVLLFAIPATCIVALASVSPELSVRWLALLGRYPLTTYVTQYYILFGARWLMTSG